MLVDSMYKRKHASTNTKNIYRQQLEYLVKLLSNLNPSRKKKNEKP